MNRSNGRFHTTITVSLRIRTLALLGILAWLTTLANASAQESNLAASGNWPQWRGHDGTGVGLNAKPPIEWSDSKNIAWKTLIPGLGHSTPVVWGNQVFLTTAIPFGPKFPPIRDEAPGSHDNLPVSQKFRFSVLCVGLDDGKIRWSTICNETIPHEGAHYSASLASASPVTNGNSLIAHFGSYGTYCLDFDGNIQWKKILGRMQTKHAHGEGASPALLDDTLVINWDHEGDSFLVAMDVKTGKELWRKERDEVTSWSSPVIHKIGDVPQVIVAGTQAVRGYDARDGTEIWSCSGLSHNIVATPIVQDDTAFVGSSYEIKSMMAIQLMGAKGDLTGTDAVRWKKVARTPYVPSPLLYRKRLYFLRHYQGILSIADTATGEEPLGPFRLPYVRDIYASPVAADGRIYITSREGVTLVLSEKEMPKLLAVNRLDARVNASLALTGDGLIMRGEKALFHIKKTSN